MSALLLILASPIAELIETPSSEFSAQATVPAPKAPPVPVRPLPTPSIAPLPPPAKPPTPSDLLFYMDISEIEIAPKNRADRRNCYAVSTEGIKQALRTCWPILKSWREFRRLIDENKTPPHEYLTRSTGDPDPRLGLVGDKMLRIAKQIIRTNRKRRYPAQDVPLVAAHFFQSGIYEARQDYRRALSEMDKAMEIARTTLINDDELKDVSKPDGDYRRLIEKVGQLEGN